MTSAIDWIRDSGIGGDIFGVPLMGDEVKIPTYNWEAHSTHGDADLPKLNRKRKSLSMKESTSLATAWDLSLEPLPFGRCLPLEEPELDMGMLDELFSRCSDEVVESAPKVARRSKVLCTPRRSEDWDAKPLNDQPSFLQEMTKKRQKWLKSELKVLWTSIAIHGNNWSLVNDILTSRSYYQIKDKGRRVLYEHGWVTGRNKKDAAEANAAAKLIAEKVMKRNNWKI